MLLEQNLFWVYRILLKAPRVLYLVALAFTVFVAFSQITYISRVSRTIDFSQLLLDYVIQKHEQRMASIDKTNSSNSNQTAGDEATINETANHEEISK